MLAFLVPLSSDSLNAFRAAILSSSLSSYSFRITERTLHKEHTESSLLVTAKLAGSPCNVGAWAIALVRGWSRQVIKSGFGLRLIYSTAFIHSSHTYSYLYSYTLL